MRATTGGKVSTRTHAGSSTSSRPGESPAAERARRWLVLTFPAERWWVRAGVRLLNAGQVIFRSPFRVFYHEPSAILRIARDAGLRPVQTRQALFWQLLALERP